MEYCICVCLKFDFGCFLIVVQLTQYIIDPTPWAQDTKKELEKQWIQRQERCFREMGKQIQTPLNRPEMFNLSYPLSLSLLGIRFETKSRSFYPIHANIRRTHFNIYWKATIRTASKLCKHLIHQKGVQPKKKVFPLLDSLRRYTNFKTNQINFKCPLFSISIFSHWFCGIRKSWFCGVPFYWASNEWIMLFK